MAAAIPRVVVQGEIQWGGNPDMCVLVEGEPAKVGYSLVVLPCRGKPFDWTAHAVEESLVLRPVLYPELCMDNPHGSVLQLWPCSEEPDAMENMKFGLHAAGSDATRGTIRPAKNASLCVSVPANQQGVHLGVWPCVQGSPSGTFMFVGAGGPANDTPLTAAGGGGDAAPLAAQAEAEAAGLGPSVWGGRASARAGPEPVKAARAAGAEAAERATAGKAWQASEGAPTDAAEGQAQEDAGAAQEASRVPDWTQEADAPRLRRQRRAAAAAVQRPEARAEARLRGLEAEGGQASTVG